MRLLRAWNDSDCNQLAGEATRPNGRSDCRMDEWQSLPLLWLSKHHGSGASRRQCEDFESLIKTMRRSCDVDACAEPERYEQNDATPYRFDLSRRTFLGVAGAGLLIVARHKAAQVQTRGQHGTIAARLHIGKNGRVTLLTGKVEVGQGSRTQLAQATAEELRVPVDRIDVVMADTAQVPDDGGTAGSRTAPSTVPAVRKGAAAARQMLIKLAREQWGVTGLLRVEDGKITDPATGRTISYADLAGLVDLPKSFDQAIPADVKLCPVNQWTVLGTSPQKVNARDIVTGAHRYPSDVVRPNMLYGKVLRAPSYGAVLTHVDLSEAQKLSGVTVVLDGNFAGCAARTSFHALKALDVLSSKVSWKTIPHPSSKELFTERGTIKLLRVVEAFECGAIQNPANLRAQVEGCIIMTLGGTLSEEIHFENGRLLNGRFSQYSVPRFKDVPSIETALLDRRDLPSVGAGETPMIAVAPAVANAVFDACTVRVRSMPIRGTALKS